MKVVFEELGDEIAGVIVEGVGGKMGVVGEKREEGFWFRVEERVEFGG